MFQRQIELLGVAGLVLRKHANDAAAGIVSGGEVHCRDCRKPVAYAAGHQKVSRAEAVTRPKGNVTLQAQHVPAMTRGVVKDAITPALGCQNRCH